MERVTEMTPIPAVASAERERLIEDLSAHLCWRTADGIRCTCHSCNAAGDAVDMLRADANLLQRAQADALDARRYRFLRDKSESPEPGWDVMFPTCYRDEAYQVGIDAVIDAALRTSSPDPVGGET